MKYSTGDVVEGVETIRLEESFGLIPGSREYVLLPPGTPQQWGKKYRLVLGKKSFNRDGWPAFKSTFAPYTLPAPGKVFMPGEVVIVTRGLPGGSWCWLVPLKVQVELPPEAPADKDVFRVVLGSSHDRDGITVFVSSPASDVVISSWLAADVRCFDKNGRVCMFGGVFLAARFDRVEITTNWLMCQVGNQRVVETRPAMRRDGSTSTLRVFVLKGTNVLTMDRTVYAAAVEADISLDGSATTVLPTPWKPARFEDTEVSRSTLGEVLAVQVDWGTVNRIPAKISANTPVDVFAKIGSADRIEHIQAVWGDLPPSMKEARLKRYPVCSCGKYRYDLSVGLGTCGKCMGVDGYGNAILPVMRALDPTVVMEPDPTGKSLRFRFGDESVSFRFSKGYGFDWDEGSNSLRAGERNLLKVWARLRPMPTVTLEEHRPLFALLGLSLEVNPSEPREVFVRGEWLEGAKELLDLKGSKKKGYTIHGAERLDEAAERIFACLKGWEIGGIVWMEPPKGWCHQWIPKTWAARKGYLDRFNKK